LSEHLWQAIDFKWNTVIHGIFVWIKPAVHNVVLITMHLGFIYTISLVFIYKCS